MTSTHRITTTAAVILSLAAGGASAAAARPAIDPPTAGNQTPTAVYSRPDKSAIPVSPPATNGGASARAAALRALSQQHQRVAALSAYREGQLAASLDVAATTAHKTSASPAAVRVQTPQSSFDWGDAGIGAAGGLALAMLGLGGGLAISHRRPRRARQSNPIPS